MTPEYRIVMSPKANRDISVIRAHISRDSPRNAANLVIAILSAIDGLKRTPNRNRVVSQPRSNRPAVRSMPVWPYMVYFRTDNNARSVSVLRIRHGFRKPLRRFD